MGAGRIDPRVIEPIRAILSMRAVQMTHDWPGALNPLSSSVKLIEASVVLPLVARDGEVCVWLIRRPDTMKRHSGQVALPGGKRETSDASALDTALRETEEEIGFGRADLDVLGALDRIPTSTGFVIDPFVAWLPRDITPRPNAGEIARVFCVPLAPFVFEEPRPRPFRGVGWSRLAPSWEIDGEIVWGATAKILGDFASIVRPLVDL